MKRLLPLLALCAVTPMAAAQGTLSDNIRIESQELDYALQYRVYTPEGHENLSDLPVLYLTDGQWYISDGNYPAVLNKLIRDGLIAPTIAVFIDNRNPDRLGQNRRNSQFFCNPAYERFIADELVPVIDETYNTAGTREQRAIMGLSFGGLNAACFALHEHDTFGNVGMQSPSTRTVPSLHTDFIALESLPVRVFLSSGDRADNEDATRRLRDILRERAFDFEYIEVPHGHTWDNWRPLLDDAVRFFFGT